MLGVHPTTEGGCRLFRDSSGTTWGEIKRIFVCFKIMPMNSNFFEILSNTHNNIARIWSHSRQWSWNEYFSTSQFTIVCIRILLSACPYWKIKELVLTSLSPRVVPTASAREECSLFPSPKGSWPQGASRQCYHEIEFHLPHVVFELVLISWLY